MAANKVVLANGTTLIDLTSDTVAAGSLLSGATAHDASGAAITGTMPNRGGVTGAIVSKAGVYTVPQGYHDGSGTVAIDAAEQAKLIPSNIKQGVTVLGVEGSLAASSQTRWRFGRYLVIHVKKMVIGSNNGVTNTANYQSYLLAESGLPGSFLGFSMLEKKTSYAQNEILSAQGMNCYRYRGSLISKASWNVASYDAIAVPGTEIIVATTEWLNPTTVDAGDDA
ncbi:MAG: hypothetical protein IJT76_01080 [Clostridia bacterium]|nr:hypothetical protein [Clostridia bacterium]